MASPVSSDVIVGTYARGEACIVVTRHRLAGTVTMSLSAPSVTLDANGHHALLQALAFPPEQTVTPLAGPQPAFTSTPKIGGSR